MLDPVAPLLSAWESFYVIVGSSGAALTGLQFVVIALVADMPPRPAEQERIVAVNSSGEVGAPA